ncbi:MAG: TonB-dependent receptor [Spongiibacteraceae bacterium]|nr:TonB-dependent receptor [Spongiibacteraceae bacterium]
MQQVPSTYRMSHKRITAALLAVASATAMAQSGGTLEEVVVTAQKREQSLQETPIAITAFNSRDLQQKGIENLTDLGTFAPNVKIASLPSNTAKAAIAIRGSVTSNPAITWEPTVGMYLDGVYIAKFSGNVFKIVELERIEVLRGPQGTLYGKNTIGGAINMITKKPTGELGGTVRAGFGNFGQWEAYGSLDLPALQLGGLGELKAKLSYVTEERDGFYGTVTPTQGPITNPLTSTLVNPNSVDTGHESNALDTESARLDLLWEISDRFALRYAYDRAEADNTPAKTQLTDVDPTNLAFQFPFPADLKNYVLDKNKSYKNTSADAEEFERYTSDSHALFADYDLGELGFLGDISLKYIFSARDLDYAQQLDNDGTPFGLFSSGAYEDYKQRSHEFQITGATERTNYVIGVYYFDEKADVENPLVSVSSFIGPNVTPNTYGLDGEQKAVYGQMEWRPPILQDRLTLTAGLRWTKEEKSSYIDHPLINDPVYSAEASDSWTNTAPTLIASYEFTESLSAYAKYSKGWKAGGFNGESPTEATFVEGYDPEEVDAFELGIKSRWLENTLQINAAAFYNDEDNLQLSVFSPSSGQPVSAVRNAGSAVKQGFEFEVLYQPVADLQFSANYGYLDADYKEFMEFDPNVPPSGAIVDKKDEKAFQYAPRHTVNAGIEYTFARGSWGDLTARLDYTYNDDYVAYVNPDQNRPLQLKGYGLFNGRLTLANMQVGQTSTLQVALWGKNLTDEEYRLNGIPFGPFAVSYYGDPRTYGLEATLEF